MKNEDIFSELDEKLVQILGYENIEHHSFNSLEECCSYYNWLTTPLLIDDELC